MSITVKSEMIAPASGKPIADNRGHYYLDPTGLRRRETRSYQSQSDTADFREHRDSPDNGRTWGEWIRDEVTSKMPIRGVDEIEFLPYPNASHIWNPVHKHYISVTRQFLYRDGYETAYRIRWTGKGIPVHSFMTIETEDGVCIDNRMVRYEDGPEFDPETYHETDYLRKNLGVVSEVIVLKNGDILFNLDIPVYVACRIAGLDLQEIFPSAPGQGESSGLMICRGKWNEETKQYDLTFSKPLILDDRQSSRGIAEPVLAELESGRILTVFRVSTAIMEGWNCRISPYAPGYKYYSYSDDGGKTFSPPMPWHFDSREVIYSSATFCRLIRSQKNGKLYWIGNITDPTKTDGSYPRFPLQIVEVDEEWGVAKKDTLTVIDTIREGESEKVQLSNFGVLQNRETGDLEIYLSKYGQHADRHIFDCESWKYTVTLPE